MRNGGAIRAALIRMLWNSAADDAVCVCEDGDPGPECEAMAALGWGKHWSRDAFIERWLDARTAEAKAKREARRAAKRTAR